MTSIQKNQRLAIIGLIALSAVPLLAGTVRLVELWGGAELTEDNARFLNSPLPVISHIISSLVYCVLGAFQFSNNIRKKHINWHRLSGRMLVPLGLVSAISGLWMTQFYPFNQYDSYALYLIRLFVGFAMSLFLILGVLAVRNKNISAHSAWMMRAYGLGLGAGTQVITHIPWFVFSDFQSELFRTVCMGLGWGINMLFVEWLIWKKNHVKPDSLVLS